MYLSLADIWEFDETAGTPFSGFFSAGDQILKSGHVVFCGRVSHEFVGYKLVAYCEQDSNRDKNPYEIKGEISSDGKVRRMSCNCGCEMNGQCQHVFAVLLYCNRHHLDRLQFVSKEEVLSMQTEDFAPKPLLEYKCFVKKLRNSSAVRLSKTQERMIKEKLYGKNFEIVVIKEEQQ